MLPAEVREIVQFLLLQACKTAVLIRKISGLSYVVFDLKAPQRNPVIPCTRALHLSLWQRMLACGWCDRRCLADSLAYWHQPTSTGCWSPEGRLGTRVAGEPASRVEAVTLPEGQAAGTAISYSDSQSKVFGEFCFIPSPFERFHHGWLPVPHPFLHPL